MNRNKITFEVTAEQRKEIEGCIKQEYPKIKTVSELVRAALDDFLEKGSNKPNSKVAL